MAERSVQEMRRQITLELAEVIEGDYIDTWFDAPNQTLNDLTPLQILEENGEEGFTELHNLIEASKQGIYI